MATTPETHKKPVGFDMLAGLSAIGMIGWTITSYFGGMVLFLLAYGFIIVPIIILYVVSFIETLISLIRNGKATSKTKLIAHGAVISLVILLNVAESDLLKSKRVMTAILKDDLFHYKLVFLKNGRVENHVYGMFGYATTYHGRYKLKDSLIVFSKRPYDNDFIPDTVLLDKTQHAIFINKNKDGGFDVEKEWLNHFEIIE